MGIIASKLTYKYSPDTSFESTAIKDISFKIEDGEFVGIIGCTGSGKSTLIQHLNGLMKPVSGSVYFNGEDIFDKDYDLRDLRFKVGMVFQYPEHQLFEETVINDVKFGPLNQGLSDKEASRRAYEALEMLSFPRDLISQSPFDLSGGQKRLAAIAGVLAMKPQVLVLDEPCAGLDPRTRKELLNILNHVHQETGNTIIIVSHGMEDVAALCDRVIVLSGGELVMNNSPREVFVRIDELERVGLTPPDFIYLMRDLRNAGLNVPLGVLTEAEAAAEIQKALVGSTGYGEANIHRTSDGSAGKNPNSFDGTGERWS